MTMNDIAEATQLNQSRRTPRQARSRSRVDAILHATQELILEKGYGNLKIQELSERAGVTPSSIYQYFPNKNAIILALNKVYIDETYNLLISRLENISSLEEGFQGLESMLDDYYEWYKSEPAISDIWYGLAANKDLQAAELQSTRQSAAIVVEKLAPFIDDEQQAELKSYAMLLSHLTGSTIRLCITIDEQEALTIINSFKKLLRSTAESFECEMV